MIASDVLEATTAAADGDDRVIGSHHRVRVEIALDGANPIEAELVG
jgi:hypothetical protein